MTTPQEQLPDPPRPTSHELREALAEAGATLEPLLAGAAIASVVLDPELRVLWFTDHARETLTLSASDIGRDLSQIDHPLDYPRLAADARTAAESLDSVEREAHGADGRWHLVRVAPYRPNDHHPDGVVLTLVDITERKRSERRAADARDFAEKIVETIHEPLLVLNDDLTVRSANPAFYENFQVDASETVGERIYSLGNRQWDIPALRELLEDVLPEDKVFNDFEVRHEFEGIGERIMLLNGRRLDHVQLILLGIRDITERQRHEDVVRKSEERHRSVIQNMAEGFCTFDMLFDDAGRAVDCRFVEVNPAFERHTGLLGASGKRMRELAPEHEEFWFETFGRIATTGEPASIEHRARALGDRWFEVHAFRIGDPEQQRIAAIFQDVSDRKRSAQELERNVDELELRVAERTAELQSQAGRLKELARELAAAENRERKRLAALIHDELQQHLVALKMRLGTARQKSDLDTVVELVTQSIGLADDAIRSARFLTQELRPPVLYEDGLVAALRWLATDLAHRHGLSVSLRTERVETPLNEDIRAMLFESTRELLFNIVKHAGVDEAEVVCREFDDRLSITVTDRGQGFDVEAAERHKREGGGLGLFSIRERLETVGGSVDIRSIPGDGSEIMIELPLGVARDETAQPEPGAPRRSGIAPAPLVESAPANAPGVLIVDDHAVVRQGLMTLISDDERVRVVGEASDGAHALEAVERLRPDVVLMDVNMPNMNGLETTRAIREGWPGVAVIGLSVQDDAATRRSMLPAGASAFVSKSDDAETVVKAILDAASRD